MKKKKESENELNISLAFSLGFRAKLGDDEANYPLIGYNDLAYAYIYFEEYEKALGTYLALLELQVKTYGKSHEAIATTLEV